MNISLTYIVVLILSCVLIGLRLIVATSKDNVFYMSAWIIAQWLPMLSLRKVVELEAWHYWDHEVMYLATEIPSVSVQEHKHDLLNHLETRFGRHWREKPLIFRNLWTPQELADPNRRLSRDGLLSMDLEIPYFTDASKKGALTPDGRAPVSAVVANITRGEPHKIGTQWIVQKNTELIEEVAPGALMKSLFGNYFNPSKVRGGDHFGLLKMTTVPVFVANGEVSDANPYTALHCEPIGNVAVQLSGSKQWTTVLPQYSFMVKPSLAKDGRAFFASWSDDYGKVPRQVATTNAGDAIWVPTWTWHRVDYVPSKDISVSGSLFHFRPRDYLTNNPLFAFLVVPAILKELVGVNTQ